VVPMIFPPWVLELSRRQDYMAKKSPDT